MRPQFGLRGALAANLARRDENCLLYMNTFGQLRLKLLPTPPKGENLFPVEIDARFSVRKLMRTSIANHQWFLVCDGEHFH